MNGDLNDTLISESDDMNGNNINKPILYCFEELEEHSTRNVKQLPKNINNNYETIDQKKNLSIIGNITQFLTNLYSIVLPNKSSNQKEEETSNNNLRESIIDYYKNTWAIDYNNYGLYICKDNILYFYQDLIPVRHIKSVDWTDKKKLISICDDLCVLLIYPFQLIIYSDLLKTTLIKIDLGKYFTINNNLKLFEQDGIQHLKITRSNLISNEKYDITFLFNNNIYCIPFLRDNTNIELYKYNIYNNQIIGFDVFNESSYLIAISLKSSETECIFRNYPEGNELIKINEQKQEIIKHKNQYNLNDERTRIIFSKDGSSCLSLSNKSNTLYLFRFKQIEENESRVVFTTKFEDILEFNWWTTSSIILCTLNREITICNIDTKENLLNSVEEVEGIPIITKAVDGRFFMLQYDFNKDQLVIDQKLVLLQKQKEQMDELMERGKQTSIFSAFSSLFSFLSSPSRDVNEDLKEEEMIPSSVSMAYKLFYFWEKLPQLEFQRKVDEGEFEEALELAKIYNINSDDIFKKMWKRQKVTLESIEKLASITDTKWVLNECLTKVTGSIDTMKALLQYGIVATDHLLKKETNSNDLYQYFNNLENDEIPSNIKDICIIRAKLLLYYDRLIEFLNINDNIYLADQYLTFRECDIVEYAKERALLRDFLSLNIIWTYVLLDENSCLTNVISPQQQLEILNNIPETTDPNEFEELLPNVDPETKMMAKWDFAERCRKKVDFVETYWFQKRFLNNNIVYNNLTSEEITQWYLKRATTIEEVSGLVSHSLVLLDIGRNSHGVLNLDKLYNQFGFLNLIIYSSNNSHDIEKQLLGFEEYVDKLSNYEKFKLLINVYSDDIVSQLKNRGLIFIDQCNESKAAKESMLYKYILEELAPQEISKCVQIFEASKPNEKHRIIKDDEMMTKLAIDCIYSCKQENVTQQLNVILKCLPKDISNEELKKKVNEVKDHVEALSILANYGIHKPISIFVEKERYSMSIFQLILQRSMKEKNSTERTFQTLFMDINRLYELVFNDINLSDIYTQFLLNCCLAGHFELVNDYITITKILPPKESDDVLFRATMELINSSISFEDNSIEIAEKCISLHKNIIQKLNLENDSKWKLEENIINILNISSKYFNNYKLPLDMRMDIKRNKSLNIIKYIIDNNEFTTDEETINAIISIATYLGFELKSEHEEIKRVVIETCLQKASKKGTSLETIETLMKQNQSSIYKLCSTLALDTTKNISFDKRRELITYAIKHCPAQEISVILESHKKLETLNNLNEENITSLVDVNDINFISRCISSYHEEFVKLYNESSILKDSFSRIHHFYWVSSGSFLSQFGILNRVDESKEQMSRMKQLEMELLLYKGSLSNSKDLIEYSILALNRGNIISFVTILLSISIENISQVKDLFDSILQKQPKNINIKDLERIMKVFAYYFSLKILIMDNEERSTLHEYLDEMNNDDIYEKAQEIPKTELNSILFNYIQEYNNMSKLCKNVQTVSSIMKKEINGVEFISNQEYRNNIFIDASNTKDIEQFNDIIKLAEEIKVNKEKLYFAHFKTILEKDYISTHERKHILTLLPSLLTGMKEDVNSLITLLLEPTKISGKNLLKLQFLYELLLQVMGDNNENTKKKKDLIDIIIKEKEESRTENEINFFDLLECKNFNTLISIIDVILNENNVYIITPLLLNTIELEDVDLSKLLFYSLEKILSNTNMDSKERINRCQTHLDTLTANQLSIIVNNMAFENNYKLPLPIRTSLIEDIINLLKKRETNEDILNQMKDTLFRLKAAKRIFQKQELEETLEVWDNFFRDKKDITIIDPLAYVILIVKNDHIIDIILSELKEEYQNIFGNVELTNQPLFMTLDTKQTYLRVIEIITKSLITQVDEIENESDSEDEEEELLEDEETIFPPNTAKLSIHYIHTIIQSINQINQDLFNTLIDQLEQYSKNENDFPLKIRIVLLKIIHKYKKKEDVKSIATPIEDNTTSNTQESTTLQTYQTRDVVAENFPNKKESLSNAIPPSEEFSKQFKELIEESTKENQWKGLSFIIRIWSKDNEMNHKFLEELLIDLLIKVKDFENILLTIALEHYDLLSEEKGNDFIKLLFNEKKDLLACEFALQLKHRSLHLMAIEKVKQLVDEENTFEEFGDIISSCISNGYTLNLIEVDSVLRMILQSGIKLEDSCEAQLIAELCLNGLKNNEYNHYLLCACEYVCSKIYGMHFMFCDLKTSLSLLRRYLQQQVLLNKESIVEELCNIALQKLTKHFN
ncbi:hypothetical protein ABK040_009891 [Willaertia magna]